MSLPGDLDLNVPLFIVTGCSGSGKSTLSRVTGKLMSNFAVFDMDLIVKNDDYQSACNDWIKIACWFGYHGKSTILFGNVPIPYDISLSEHTPLFRDVRYLHLHCSHEVRTQRLLSRNLNWTPEIIKSELYLADLMLERCQIANPITPVIDTSNHSVEESVNKIFEWVRS